MICKRCNKEIEFDFCFESNGLDGEFLNAYCYPCFKYIKETPPFSIEPFNKL